MNELSTGRYDYLQANPHNVDAESVLINAGEGETATVTYDGVAYRGIVELNHFGNKSIVVKVDCGEHIGDWIAINWSKDL